MAILNDFLKSIADAIRSKKGTTAKIKAKNFASEIGSIEIGENTLKKLFDYSKSCYNMFYKNNTITDLTGYIDYNDTSNVTDMTSMFFGCSKLTTIPQLNTSKVTNMKSMFSGCTSLTAVPQLETSSVTNMSSMFNGCKALTTIPQLDTSKVTSMTQMFFGCSKLTTIPELVTSNVTGMQYMFQGCTSLTTISLLDVSKVTNMKSMFSGCSNLTNLTLLNIKINLEVEGGHLLTLESLIGLCQQCVNVNASRKLTVGTDNLKKLANVYVKFTDSSQTTIAVGEKGENMIQCESTDTGAMTISAYMSLKNWSLA